MILCSKRLPFSLNLNGELEEVHTGCRDYLLSQFPSVGKPIQEKHPIKFDLEKSLLILTSWSNHYFGIPFANNLLCSTFFHKEREEKMRILIVDNNQDLAIVIKWMLEGEGYEVRLALGWQRRLYRLFPV